MSKAKLKTGQDAAETPKTPDTYQLIHPIEYEGERIESLSLRRVKVKDQIKAADTMRERGIDPAKITENEHLLYVLARITGQPVEALWELDAVDFGRLQAQWTEHFF